MALEVSPRFGAAGAGFFEKSRFSTGTERNPSLAAVLRALIDDFTAIRAAAAVAVTPLPGAVAGNATLGDTITALNTVITCVTELQTMNAAIGALTANVAKGL